jgi:hypothetical protein
VIGFLLVLLAASGGGGPRPDPGLVAAGERIYREGRLPSGAPLRARAASGEISGADAACVLCHRRSGLGSYEGNRLVPPIIGRYLFASRAADSSQMNGRHSRGPDLAHALGRERPRPPYTEASLLDAVREGRSASGESLDPLMPRYALDDAASRALVAYLRQLSASPSAGITEDTVQLATVIAPGVDPERRRLLVEVLRSSVDLHNNAVTLDRLRDHSSPGARHVRYRRWVLQTWDLTGPPAGWDAQLESRYRKAPVFALLSGLSEGEWRPVERFAERRGIPTWFPTVDAPPLAEGEFYSAYFTDGVKGEAAVLVQRIQRTPGITRVVQLRGPGATEDIASGALLEGLRPGQATVVTRPVEAASPASLKAALADLGPGDALVLWFRPAQIRLLGEATPPAGPIFLSGLLGGGEHAPLPPSWRSRSELVYPFELPERRRAQANRFVAWLRARNLPLTDERVQAEAYLAVQLFGARMDEMLEDLQRDHLLERAESFLAERVSPVLFRRLDLSVGQRIASRGAYLVRFSGPDGAGLHPEGEWIAP